MRQIDYTDERGRKYRVLLPDDAPDEQAPVGIPVGPPDVVDDLGLPPETATRLHNALFRHGLWNAAIAAKNANLLMQAVLSTFKIDAQVLQEAFYKLEKT